MRLILLFLQDKSGPTKRAWRDAGLRFLILALALILGETLPQRVFGQDGAIALDHVTGWYRGDTVLAGADLRFVIKYTNNTGRKCDVTNGFKIVSPDGATWLDARIDTIGPNPGGINHFRQYFNQAFLTFDHADGVDHDTVGFLGSGSYIGLGYKLPAGYSDTCMAISVDMPSDPLVNVGRHICIDSVRFGSAGYWEWSTTSGGCDWQASFPEFNGPAGVTHQYGLGYCFAIKDVTWPYFGIAASRARPGFRKFFVIWYENTTSRNLTNTSIVLTLPAAVSYLSTFPFGSYTSSSHSVLWSIGTLSPGASGVLICDGTVSPTVPLGSSLNASAYLSALEPDGTPYQRLRYETERVVGSFDPNDKQAWPEGEGANREINLSDTLRYQINFQNVGTDTAFTIVVRDTLSPYLDETTFLVGPSSHSGTFAINGREMIWTFSDIKLPDSTTDAAHSEGFVSFEAQPRQDIVDRTFVANRASIYFDFNPPVATNTVEHQVRIGCCLGTTGNVNDGAAQTPDLSDLSHLISYLTVTPRTSLPCVEEANINSSGSTDLSDLSLLIAYLTVTPRPILPSCP